MRVFIGIKVLEPSLLKKIKHSINSKYCPRIKWVKKENLHLTLVYIGTIQPTEIEKIKPILSRIAQKNQPFNMTIKGIGLFKKKRKNTILWLKVSPIKEFKALQKGLLDMVKSELQILQDEHETFTPHITIGRCSKYISLPEQLPYLINETQIIRGIQLFESRSTTNGIEYKIVDQFKLG